MAAVLGTPGGGTTGPPAGSPAWLPLSFTKLPMSNRLNLADTLESALEFGRLVGVICLAGRPLSPVSRFIVDLARPEAASTVPIA
jgi:hypothetical protein